MDTIHSCFGMVMEKDIIVGQEQPSLSFYNHKTKSFQKAIWAELEGGMWREYMIDNFVSNEAVGNDYPEKWKPVFPQITPIIPGYRWNEEQSKLEHRYYYPKRMEAVSLNTFLEAVERFFDKFRNKKIGVHLSGGLDSTLIICLLRYFNIPFVLGGLESKRFEMRTERHIQHKIREYGETSFLIDIEDVPFFGGLDCVPKHQVPDEHIRGNDADRVLADAFQKAGVEVVFSGQGGDSLLMEDETHGLARYNLGFEFQLPWSQEHFYGPRGIQLISFFADEHIIDQISNLRLGQQEDSAKLWARHFFREFLPRELSEYCYVGDYFGLTLDGLERAKPLIKCLMEESYELTQHVLFAPKQADSFLKTNVYALEIKDYIDFCSRISVAVWLHSLFRNDSV